MGLKELVKVIETENIELAKGDSFIVLAKCGNELHTAYEGERRELLELFVRAAQSYKDFDTLLQQIAEIYMDTEENGF